MNGFGALPPNAFYMDGQDHFLGYFLSAEKCVNKSRRHADFGRCLRPTKYTKAHEKARLYFFVCFRVFRGQLLYTKKKQNRTTDAH